MFEPSPFDFKAMSDQCYKDWGVRPDPHKLLTLYEEKSVKSGSNMIFSNGLRDPWSAGGVLESLSDTVVAFKISHGCHHEDLRATGVNDTQELINVRKQEIMIIKDWINDYYTQINYFP